MKFKKFCRLLSNGFKTIFLTVIIVFFCGIALWYFGDDYKIYPISYITFGWLLALFFPALSITYNVARQRVKLKEVLNLFRQDKLWDVYFPRTGEEAEYEFEKFLWKRLYAYYNRFESVGFSLLIGAIVFIMYFLLADVLGASSELKSWDFESQKWAALIGSSFLGSYSGSIVLALRRYRTFDLRPTVFLQVAVALIAGTLAGAFITVLYPTYQLGVLAFIVGFLTAINIRFLSRLMRKFFAKITQVPLPPLVPSDLNSVIKNEEAIESLNRISIFSVRELACTDPIPLYFNMPQQNSAINSMIDQAVLHFHFPHIVHQLERLHIQSFSQLLTRVGMKIENRESKWPEKVEIIDDGKKEDKQLLEAAKAIVKSGQHHKILGLCLYHYREALFREESKEKESITKKGVKE
ncbi:hypothetical protein KA005_16280, partial [bacterium]|nr:hypothetical protein [bacterium]